MVIIFFNYFVEGRLKWVTLYNWKIKRHSMNGRMSMKWNSSSRLFRRESRRMCSSFIRLFHLTRKYTANRESKRMWTFFMLAHFLKIRMLETHSTDRSSEMYRLVLTGTDCRFIRIGLFILDSLNIGQHNGRNVFRVHSFNNPFHLT